MIVTWYSHSITIFIVTRSYNLISLLYEVQEVITSEYTSTGYFSVNCTFLPGSQVKGCAIEVFNKAGEYIFSQDIHRLSSTSL